jgi:hypothetical protein
VLGGENKACNKILVDDGEGNIATGALYHGAEGIAGAAEAGGDGVGVVNGHERRENLVHSIEHRFRASNIYNCLKFLK